MFLKMNVDTEYKLLYTQFAIYIAPPIDLLKEAAMVTGRHVSIFRNGHNQAIYIPQEFELAGTEAIIRKEGECLIIEPMSPRNRLLALLAGWDELDIDFSEIADPPPTPEDVI
jgi:antitoxin VapB